MRFLKKAIRDVLELYLIGDLVHLDLFSMDNVSDLFTGMIASFVSSPKTLLIICDFWLAMMGQLPILVESQVKGISGVYLWPF